MSEKGLCNCSTLTLPGRLLGLQFHHSTIDHQALTGDVE
jgi:hypothetical protein